MLATTVSLAWCWRAATVLRLLLWRGHIGAGPLERVFPAVDDLPRPDEDPRTGRGPAELVDVKVRDLAPALHRLGQPAQEDAVAPGYRHAPAAPSHPEHKGEPGGRLGHSQSQRNHPAPVADFQRLDRIRKESLPLGGVEHPRLSVGGEGAVDLAEEPVGEHPLLPGRRRPGDELLVGERAPHARDTAEICLGALPVGGGARRTAGPAPHDLAMLGVDVHLVADGAGELASAYFHNCFSGRRLPGQYRRAIPHRPGNPALHQTFNPSAAQGAFSTILPPRRR